MIGSGYVGLVTGACLSDFNHQITCVDINKNIIDKLNNGQVHKYEPGLKELINKNLNKNLFFSFDINQTIKNNDIIFIAVGTPTNKSGKVDLSFINIVIDTIIKNLNSYKIIVIKSTVPPGTSIEIINKFNSMNVDKKKYDIVTNPEFLREGAAIGDFMIPDRIIIGTESEKAKKYMNDIYKSFFLRDIPIIYTNHNTSELIKYSTNAFLAMKISFINEISLLCKIIDADINTISKSLGLDGRISPKFLHPSPGFGGSCFPKDVLGLKQIFEENDIDTKIIKNILNSNQQHKKNILNIFLKLFKNKIQDKLITVLGLSFKPRTDDIRESPAITVLHELLKKEVIVHAYDPEANENMMQLFPDIKYFDNVYDAIKNSDGIILLTEWNELRSLSPCKVKSIMNGNIFMDTRNIYNPKDWIDEGFNFTNLGRLK